MLPQLREGNQAKERSRDPISVDKHPERDLALQQPPAAGAKGLND